MDQQAPATRADPHACRHAWQAHMVMACSSDAIAASKLQVFAHTLLSNCSLSGLRGEGHGYHMRCLWHATCVRRRVCRFTCLRANATPWKTASGQNPISTRQKRTQLQHRSLQESIYICALWALPAVRALPRTSRPLAKQGGPTSMGSCRWQPRGRTYSQTTVWNTWQGDVSSACLRAACPCRCRTHRL